MPEAYTWRFSCGECHSEPPNDDDYYPDSDSLPVPPDVPPGCEPGEYMDLEWITATEVTE